MCRSAMTVGYVMMYSDRLDVHDNVSDGDRDHGLLFNYANDSRIEDNVVRGSDKCVFIYNANKNRFAGNWFEGCQIGVHFTAGSEGNEITGNAFVNNRIQVMYVGTRLLDWSVARARQLLQRQPGLRPQGKRDRRHCLPAQRSHGPGDLAGARRQNAAE